MIYRLFPTSDTFITDAGRLNVPQTGSNFGASEVLHLFSISPISSSLFSTSGSVARVLVKFDTSSIPSVTGSATGSVSYTLVLRDAQHAHALPSSFDVEVVPASGNWDEGKGQDVDTFFDKGFANWDRRRSNALWSVSGGDAYASPVATQSFDTGHEDLRVDVLSHVASWLSGTIPNDGFLVRLSSSLERSSVDYYIKMFHSRQTHFLDKRPYLQVAWDDTVRTGSVSFATDDGPFFVNVTNIKNEYETDELTRFRLFVRKRDYNPAVVVTASLNPVGLVVDRSFYRVDNDRTRETVIPFGTGSIETTRLSHDASGSYFDFRMSNLSPGEVYKLVFLFNISGSRQVVDQGFRFRVA